nr:hypothetical protein [Caldilineaceae bacterium]
RCLNRRHSGAGCTVQAIALSGVTPHVSEGLLQVGGAPTFLEGVGVNHRIRSGRLTPSRKVGQGRCHRLPQL